MKIMLNKIKFGDFIKVRTRKKAIWVMVLEIREPIDEYEIIYDENDKFLYRENLKQYWKDKYGIELNEINKIFLCTHIGGTYSSMVYNYPDSVIIDYKKNKLMHKIENRQYIDSNKQMFCYYCGEKFKFGKLRKFHLFCKMKANLVNDMLNEWCI